MHTIEAIYNGVDFKLMQPIPVNESYKVFITFVEPVKKDNKEKMTMAETLGCMRGQFKMADDFDAPLEDFKEYME
jgi:predicted DNA-binding antitoxin AbrB/MazE fold protein